MKQRKEGRIEYLATGSIVLLFFFVLCAVKGIFPFGTATIDTSDFESQWVPGYYHVWDVLHGRAALLFDWRVGGGNNFAAVSSQFSLISPFNLFFLLIKRSWIEPAMTCFIALKLLAMAMAMCFFLRNYQEQRRLPAIWSVTGAVAYALSGYTFLYYGMGWIDTAAIFPILIFFLVKMARHEDGYRMGRYTLGYTLCLAMIFVMCIPQAYMVCLFLVLFAGGYFFLLREMDGVPSGGILKFGLTTLLALGLSGVIFLPAAVGILNSFRLSGDEFSGVSGYFYLLRQEGMDAWQKWLMLAGVGIPFIYLLVTGKRSRRCLWQYYLAGLMVIPVLVEAVNLLWHRGTYVCFPMRHGYMMVFAVLAMAAERLAVRQRFPGLWKKKKWRAGICTVLAVWGVITCGVAVRQMIPLSHEGGVNFVQDAEEIGTVLAGWSDIFHKTKLTGAAVDNNYPLISGTASYANYLHLMTTGQIALTRQLGYSQVWTRLSDTGGTFFSDALLGYQYWISAKESADGYNRLIQEGLGQPVEETFHFTVAESPYVYGPGLAVSRTDYARYQEDMSTNVFENQNMLSQMFFGKSFFEIKKEEFSGEDAKTQYHFVANGRKALYLYSQNLWGAEIFVNGDQVFVPSFEDLEGTSYPVTHNNGTILLGLYEDEDITVTIQAEEYGAGVTAEVYFGMLDMDAFTESLKPVEGITYQIDVDSCRIHVTSAGEEYLFLPVNADAGWQVSVNGREVSVSSLYGSLMMIPLDEKGENEILMEFVPRGYRKGFAVTVAAVLVLLLWGALSMAKEFRWLKKLYQVASYVAMAVFLFVYAGFLLVMYVIPIGYTVYLLL